MILTTCAACAAPLAHDAPRCVRCKTRYCDSTCQHDHWRRGHKQICKKIHRAGNAEQYHADQKYKEAVAVAVEACADDTKGQTCFICTEALHWKTKEGLVRGCACRGTAGFAHVSCLAEQAKILMDETEENSLGFKVQNERWGRWYTCGLCEQRHHGVVQCALGWACWKTYGGRPEKDDLRRTAINILGNGLSDTNHHEDALSVRTAELSMERRLGAPEENIFAVMGNLAITYGLIGRTEEALALKREALADAKRLYGPYHAVTINSTNNVANSLTDLGRYEEVKPLMRDNILACRRCLGDDHIYMFRARASLAEAVLQGGDCPEAVAILEDVCRRSRRVLGEPHPEYKIYRNNLEVAKADLACARAPEGA